MLRIESGATGSLGSTLSIVLCAPPTVAYFFVARKKLPKCYFAHRAILIMPHSQPALCLEMRKRLSDYNLSSSFLSLSISFFLSLVLPALRQHAHTLSCTFPHTFALSHFLNRALSDPPANIHFHRQKNIFRREKFGDLVDFQFGDAVKILFFIY